MGYCSSTRHCVLIYPHIPKHVGGSSLCGTRGTHVHTDLFSRSVSPRFPVVGMCQGSSLFYDTVNTAGKFKAVSRLSWNARKCLAKNKVLLWCVQSHRGRAYYCILLYQHTSSSSLPNGIAFYSVGHSVLVNWKFLKPLRSFVLACVPDGTTAYSRI
jgi:hypothetical protein